MLATSWTAARKLRGLLVAGGDRTKLLDLGEEALDQMARAIKLSIVVARQGPVGSRRDHRGLTSGSQRLEYASIGVERPVGDQRIGRHRGQQVVRPHKVRWLAPGQKGADWVGQRGDHGVGLGSPTT